MPFCAPNPPQSQSERRSLPCSLPPILAPPANICCVRDLLLSGRSPLYLARKGFKGQKESFWSPWKLLRNFIYFSQRDTDWQNSLWFYWSCPLGRSVIEPQCPSVCIFVTLRNTHFQVSWRPLVDEWIPNICLWLHIFKKRGACFFPKNVKTRGFGPA